MNSLFASIPEIEAKELPNEFFTDISIQQINSIHKINLD